MLTPRLLPDLSSYLYLRSDLAHDHPFAAFFLALRRTRAEKVQRVTERLAQDHHVVPELHCCGSAQ